MRFAKALVWLVAAGFIVGGIGLVWVVNLKIPDFGSFQERLISQSTKIYDRTGEVVLYDIHENVTRRLVPLESISKDIKNAIIAIEDDQFYQHHGINPSAILRAFLVDIGSGSKAQGGSTITQQLIKNSLLTQEQSLSRKIKEAILSLKIERVMSKDQILGLYLNEVPYGGTMYGIEEATQTFFRKSSNEVTLAEAAYLAAIPQAPTYYSPYGNHREQLDARKNLVLKRMRELGFITESEAKQAASEKVTFAPPEDTGIKAPHFVLWVKDYLAEKYGQDALEHQGFKVITTLDWDLQKKAEEIVKRYATENATKFNARNAGLVAIDPQSGDVLAMVGSKDYFDTEEDGNFNITLAHRQPGSSLKPFIYAAGFNKGYTPDTVLFDVETQFDTTCGPNGTGPNCYSPKNYDGTFRGPMTLRNALAQSINIPALKMLYLVGMSDALNTLQKMGITSLTDPARYGLTLVLGGGEVSLLELTSAYGVFAADGVRNPYQSILKVEDKDGRVLEEATPHPKQVLPENTARLISDVLSDNKAREPLYGANNPINFTDREVAVKTGTTNNYRDAWVIGYTPNLVVGTWAGNNDNTEMEKRVSGLILAPLWRAFMDYALPHFPDARFPAPAPTDPDLKPVLRGVWQGSESYYVDKISGLLATEYTPEETKEERTAGQIHSILYYVNKSDPTGSIPVNPENDPQFDLWEAPVRRWVAANGIREGETTPRPTAYDNVHVPEARPTVTITNPNTTQTYQPGQRLTITLNYQGRYPIGQADFFFNDDFLGSVKQAPYEFSFVPNDRDSIAATNKIKVVVYDQVRNRGEQTTTFKLNVQ
jgi:1A family penicillin-binding protein